MLYRSTSPRIAARIHTLLTSSDRSSTSWLITTRPPACALRKPRSQLTESASRWLVGSSSSSVVPEPLPPPDSAAANRMRATPPRGRHQEAGEFYRAARPAGQRRERLGQHAVGEAEVRADSRGLALGRVAAE